MTPSSATLTIEIFSVLNMQKVALITGITGQDGSYLAELLLDRNYKVHGVVRRSSCQVYPRISHLSDRLILHLGDITDACNIRQIVSRVSPDEIYNLAGQSDVGVSFECPEYTSQVNAMGVLHVLEAIRSAGISTTCKLYQASTSEMFGNSIDTPQTILTPFRPRSPYGVSKVFGHGIVVNYREAYGIFAVNGILFNHESPRRGVRFVTQKIIAGVVDIVCGSSDPIVLGNLSSKRDWGHAADYVEAMWMMLQQKEPKDFIICSGSQVTVRDFVTKAFQFAHMKVQWDGHGLNERGTVNKKLVVRVDSKYLRPTEVDSLLGCPKGAIFQLKWKPRHTVDSIVQDMMSAEMERRNLSRLPADFEKSVGA